VIWDPRLPKTIRAAEQMSIIDYNVFEGVEVTAQARHTISRGKVVWSHGQNARPSAGHGKYVPRPAFPAVSRALSVWKDLNSPRFIKRDPQNIPSGV
jgi:dihydropyrimidinase